MIFFDTETTELPKAAIVPLNMQPEIVEFAAIKTDDNCVEISRLEFICKPKNPMPAHIIKIHGITNDDVINKKPFAAHYKKLCDFFLGETRLIAQNAIFDVNMLDLELKRLDLHRKFPWPPIHTCTIELIKSTGRFKNSKLGTVFEELFGKPIEGAHRAMVDVEAMVDIYRELNG